MNIIVADIGATKVKVGSFIEQNGRLELVHTQRYLTKDSPHLAAILQNYLDSRRDGTVTALAIGVAGPVTGKKNAMTNLSWVIDTSELVSVLRIPEVYLVNDLVAHGYGIAALDRSGYVTLQEGIRAEGNQAVIAAGTGLGECCLFRGERGHHSVCASEGGHSDFGPRNLEELELLRFLFARYGHRVSWERVVSGKFGFRNLYDFLKETGVCHEDPELARAIEGKQEIGFELVGAAHKKIPIAEKVVELFSELYLSEAGNLALKLLAVEGVYLSGGIAEQLLPWLQRPQCLDAFSVKGRMSPLLKNMPLHVITDPNIALKGLSRFARLALEGLL